MIEFLLQIAFGCKEITKKYHPLYLRLQKLGCIKTNGKIFQLHESFVFGVIDFYRNNSMFVSDLAKKQEYFVSSYCSGHKGDIVVAKMVKKRGKISVVIIDILQSCNRFLCYLDLHKGKIVGYKMYEEKPRPISLPIAQKALRQLPRGCVILMDMKGQKILEILGVLEDEAIDEKIILLHYMHPMEFSEESNNYAQSFGVEVDKSLYLDRIDLSHLPFYTIDPSSAKDHDDAIFFDSKKKILYVAIADVSEYVTQDSVIDIEARQRGFSLYFPHKSYPMLPRNLSENICSLKEGAIRLAFTWMIFFDKNYEIKKSHLFESIICNHQNITYEEVDNFLEGKNHAIKQDIAKSIKSFYEVAQKLYKKRIEKGYAFSSSEVAMKLNANNSLESVFVYEETKSHQIVEEAMLLANKESAKMLEGYTKGIFRVHSPIKEEKKQILFFDLKNLGFLILRADFHTQIKDIQRQAVQNGMIKEIDQMIIKMQNKAQYASKKEEHFALGFEAYTHFTSPIRRYSDLFLHRLLKEILRGNKKIDFLLTHTDSLCAFLNEQERKIAKMEIGFKDRKYMHWALRNQGREVEVMVIDVQYPVLAKGLGEILGARIVVEGCFEVEKFDKILVEITDVDLNNARIFAVFKGIQQK
ncbi:RNB domain-containing ribonuclease [Helicobacter anatolicus]|uniref:RNB domain-containing ribonuclease n=1 Tax=Helicobacter anatolicus TaxID=2905874 RepID=UPI001E2CD7A6|nr:ribonuclease R family protein [Helicobacter anatolicus]MCE3038887.1 ribonuclease R [Helicobacter anatolicus]